MEISYSKPAAKTLSKMPRNQADTIRAKVEQLADAPEELANNIKWIATMNCHRLRVGDWRIFYDADGNILAITAITKRGRAYR